MTLQYPIKDKVAVITGGTQSLGFCIAQRLARLGAKIVIGGRNPAGAEKATEINNEVGPNTAIFQQCDVTDSSALHILIDLATEHFGQLDILVNNAGIFSKPWYQDPTGSDSCTCVDTNLRALIDGTNHALHIWSQGISRGVVINIASISGYIPLNSTATYAATKAAAIAFTKGLSELAPKIRVNAIAPSWIDTKFLDVEHIGRNHFTMKGSALLDPQKVVDQVIRLIEDESFAGDVIIIKDKEEPKLCTLPKAHETMEAMDWVED
ncbi:hypothetical protein IWW36_000932 [Coemansia brasiliensis]|uniref:Uncharacterized protein n=1 Tax=Coemansia brasiliensis TaxID=2650707 RepID=A0A9W8LZH2_9FUNG|nr:hypothetical protein IWW36_000932 [Coemansia brasiliensis]